jgi:hypothetical protein
MLTIRQDQMNTMAAATGQPVIVPCVRSWIEFQLVDEDGNPVPNVKYRVKTPDGSSFDGALNDQGTVRFDNIDPGQCEITFPEIDARQWGPADQSTADGESQ